MIRASLLGLSALVAVAILVGCGDTPSTPIAPDQPKADPGVPKNIDEIFKNTHKDGPKH